MIDPQADAPAWRVVVDDLRGRIDSGELAPGSMLRAERDLAHDYDVGKNVVTQALRHLAAHGALYLEAGRRALVRRRVRQTVILEPGARLSIRSATRADQRKLAINASATVVEVRYGAEEPEVYDAYVTDFVHSERGDPAL